ncbi:MAG: hypothetical protein HYT93_01910 [Parcubacteria group bacterium]|nr:hypothetical protein [Parcubacteria group bacterium]
MMEALTQYSLIFIGIAVGLAAIAVWSPRRFWVKSAAIILTVLFVASGYAALMDLLSRPKPVHLEWVHRSAKDAAVLGVVIKEGKGIYLWLQLRGVPEPRYYVLPWNRPMAERLQEAMRQAQRNKSGLMMKSPFEYKRSLDTLDQLFYPLPQPAAPLKEPPAQSPRTFERLGPPPEKL